MGEIAPGVFVTPLLPKGTAYIVDMRSAWAIGGLEDFGERGRGLAIPEVDWQRIDAAERERILDSVIRDSAEAGLERLQTWLREFT